MTIGVLLCPPLFFAQRRQWFSFVMNGILYAVCVFSIVVGCGRLQYTYNRWADGRYLLKFSDPWANFPTVLERGP